MLGFSAALQKGAGCGGYVGRRVQAEARLPAPPRLLQLSTPRELMLFMTGEALLGAARWRCCAIHPPGHGTRFAANSQLAGMCYTGPELFPPPWPAMPSSFALSRPRSAELLARIEAHPDNQLSAQDMEIAVSKALEQAV